MAAAARRGDRETQEKYGSKPLGSIDPLGQGPALQHQMHAEQNPRTNGLTYGDIRKTMAAAVAGQAVVQKDSLEDLLKLVDRTGKIQSFFDDIKRTEEEEQKQWTSAAQASNSMYGTLTVLEDGSCTLRGGLASDREAMIRIQIWEAADSNTEHR